MVNHCCVQGCGRNSKNSAHLNYYTLPKEKYRRFEWFKAAGRDDLIALKTKTTYRVCSRHFSVGCVKNRTLTPDAVPTLCLPHNSTETKEIIQPHHDILCDNCKKTIIGFRYKCVTCADYDLCPKCEMQETHTHHYMIRIPKPLKFKIADNLIKKWRAFFKAEHVQPDCRNEDSSGCSSDDEPISKHVKKHYDSGVDLPEDVKETIRNEVARVLSIKPEEKRKRKKRGDDSSTSSRQSKSSSCSKKSRTEKHKGSEKPSPSTLATPVEAVAPPAVPAPPAPVVFADVNEYTQVDVKNEVQPPTSSSYGDDVEYGQPLMHVRLSEDLTELMIEMSKSGDKTVYKYN